MPLTGTALLSGFLAIKEHSKQQHQQPFCLNFNWLKIFPTALYTSFNVGLSSFMCIVFSKQSRSNVLLLNKDSSVGQKFRQLPNLFSDGSDKRQHSRAYPKTVLGFHGLWDYRNVQLSIYPLIPCPSIALCFKTGVVILQKG